MCPRTKLLLSSELLFRAVDIERVQEETWPTSRARICGGTVIVGVHGIAQQQLGRHQLMEPWSLALTDGVEKATGDRKALIPLDVAYYGDLFHTDAQEGTSKSAEEEISAWVADDDELSELWRAAAELGVVETINPVKAATRTPLALQSLFRSIDRHFGAAAGVLFVGELRQVRNYLTDPELKRQVHSRIEASVTGETSVLIGHSLGSVVVAEFLAEHQDLNLDLVMTAGSPLGLRMVRDRLSELALKPSRRSGIRRWVNIRDARDPVACGGKITEWWPYIEEVEVDNGRDAHSATRYFSKKAVGEALMAAAAKDQ
jgi:hypothetical protein